MPIIFAEVFFESRETREKPSQFRRDRLTRHKTMIDSVIQNPLVNTLVLAQQIFPERIVLAPTIKK